MYFFPVTISNCVLGGWIAVGVCFAPLSIKGVLRMLLGVLTGNTGIYARNAGTPRARKTVWPFVSLVRKPKLFFQNKLCHSSQFCAPPASPAAPPLAVIRSFVSSGGLRLLYSMESLCGVPQLVFERTKCKQGRDGRILVLGFLLSLKHFYSSLNFQPVQICRVQQEAANGCEEPWAACRSLSFVQGMCVMSFAGSRELLLCPGCPKPCGAAAGDGLSLDKPELEKSSGCQAGSCPHRMGKWLPAQSCGRAKPSLLAQGVCISTKASKCLYISISTKVCISTRACMYLYVSVSTNACVYLYNCIYTKVFKCLYTCISTKASQSPPCSELRVQMEPHKGPGLDFPGCHPRLPKALWDWAMIPIRYLLNL